MNALTEDDLDALADLDRLQAVASYDLNDPDLVEELDAIAANTARQLQQPIAMTNLMLDAAGLVKGSYGLEGYGDSVNTPAEWSFCVPVVRSGSPRVIDDFTQDPDEHDNPLVVHAGVRSYAGVPLSAPGGQILGTHCVVGTEPHHFSRADLDVLRYAAAEVVTTLERYSRN
jgi:GAF domain-containing protein